MAKFTDNAGREWIITVNVGSVRRVRDLAGVNLLDIADGGKVIGDLLSDPCRLVDTVYAICKPQADVLNVSDEMFGESLVGDSIDRATQALFEGIADFFPQGRRQALMKVIQKLNDFQKRTLEAASAKLDSPELDRLMQQALSDFSGSLPGSSVLTPNP